MMGTFSRNVGNVSIGKLRIKMVNDTVTPVKIEWICEWKMKGNTENFLSIIFGTFIHFVEHFRIVVATNELFFTYWKVRGMLGRKFLVPKHDPEFPGYVLVPCFRRVHPEVKRIQIPKVGIWMTMLPCCHLKHKVSTITTSTDIQIVKWTKVY